MRAYRLRLDENNEVYEEEIDPSKYISVPSGLPVATTPESRYWEALHNEIAIAETEAFCAAVDAMKISRGGIKYPTPKEE